MPFISIQSSRNGQGLSKIPLRCFERIQIEIEFPFVGKYDQNKKITLNKQHNVACAYFTPKYLANNVKALKHKFQQNH